MAGEPRFVFYPPFSWMLGAILGVILPWAAAPIAFTLIVLTGCGFSMNKLARKWLPPNAATVAACAYILNPYALFVAYERTAYAELAAGIWLPLIILYALQPDCHPERSAKARSRRTGTIRLVPSSTESCHPERSTEGAESKDLQFQRSALIIKTLPLALTIAAIWLTNAPAAVMACYALAAITIWIARAKAMATHPQLRHKPHPRPRPRSLLHPPRRLRTPLGRHRARHRPGDAHRRQLPLCTHRRILPRPGPPHRVVDIRNHACGNLRFYMDSLEAKDREKPTPAPICNSSCSIRSSASLEQRHMAHRP